MKQLTIGPGLCFFHEETAWPGVRRVAGMVQEDIRLVTGTRPADAAPGDAAGTAVLYGTVGRSAMLDALEQSGKIALDGVRGKWEVYLFALVEDPLPGIRRALVIAGSDKRGTIYGLFHLSERIGVSPLVHWNHVWPRRRAPGQGAPAPPTPPRCSTTPQKPPRPGPPAGSRPGGRAVLPGPRRS